MRLASALSIEAYMPPGAPPFTGPTYVGPVATRASAVSTSLVNGTTTYMTRKFFTATENIRDICLVLSNFAVTGQGAAEANSGGTLTCSEAWLEYPAGAFQRITFGGGNATGSTAGDTLSSDLTALGRYVPRGAKAFVVFAVSSTVAMPVCTNFTPTFGPPQYLPGGDACQAGGTDHTNVVDDGTGTSVWPVAILGTTQYATWVNLSDSRGVLQVDAAGTNFGTGNASGLVGEAMTALGGAYGFLNLGVPGDQAQRFILNYKKRMAVAQYATHVFCAFGINNPPASAAAFLADYDVMREGVASKPFYGTTLSPHPSSSTDGWSTVGNQTLSGVNTTLQAINASLRGSLPASWTGLQDVASFTESGGAGAPSGKWNAPNYTGDGLHARGDVAGAGNNAIVFSFGTAPVYTPPVIVSPSNSTPILWFDAATGVTSSGGLVTAWNDQSSNALVATASGAFRPSLVTDASFNGRPYISFNGSTALTLPAFTCAGAKTIFMVGQLGNTATVEQIAFALKDIGGASGSEFIFLNSGSFRQVTFCADATATNAVTVGYDPTNDLSPHGWIGTYLGGGNADPTKYLFTHDGVMQISTTGSFLNRPIANLGSIGGRLNSVGAISQGTVIKIAFLAVYAGRPSFAVRAGMKLNFAQYGVS